jgi:peptidoglycan-associated lipoprotein
MQRQRPLTAFVTGILLLLASGCATPKDTTTPASKAGDASPPLPAIASPAPPQVSQGMTAISTGAPSPDRPATPALAAAIAAEQTARPAERVAPQRAVTDLAGPISGHAKPMTAAIQDIFFDFDSAMLTPEAVATLRRTLAWLIAHPDATVVIQGHCDERGSAEYNLGLGHRRAGAAADYLTKAGLEPARVRTVSYGKELPFALGHDEDAWKLNRRAHFEMHDRKGPLQTQGQQLSDVDAILRSPRLRP